jgi:hypothetical protein
MSSVMPGIVAQIVMASVISMTGERNERSEERRMKAKYENQ